MKWYWILLIALGAVLLGYGLSVAVSRTGIEIGLGKAEEEKATETKPEVASSTLQA